MIDHYSAVEDAVIALVKDHIENKATYFTQPAKQVVKSDDTVLTGGFEYFFITYPGAFPTNFAGTEAVNVLWSVEVEIFVRFSTPSTTWAHFKAFRSDLFNLFNVAKIGRTLNRTAGILNCVLSGNTEPIAYAEEGTSDPTFFSQKLLLSVDYKINKA